MSDQLSKVLETYFASASAGDIEKACACFEKDAAVHDEARNHEGLFAIRVWIEETTRRYQPKMKVLHVTAKEDETVVTAEVSGSFPGSPLELDYSFTLREGKIFRLHIG